MLHMREARSTDIKKILATAHAGCMNTKSDSLDSVYAGVAAGADVIEVDVRFMEKQIPVLSHNAFRQERIKELVRLEEVLQVLKACPGVALNLDMKEIDGIPFLVELLHKTEIYERAFFTGLTSDAVMAAGQGRLSIPYFLNYQPDLWKINDGGYLKELTCMTKGLGAIGINLYYEFATQKLVRVFHQEKLKVFVWTVDNAEDMGRMIRMGIDSITSNRVDCLIKKIKEAERCFAEGATSSEIDQF